MPEEERTSRRRAIARLPGALGASAIIPPAAEVRFVDAAIATGVSAGSVLWTATRAPGPDIGWAAFWTALGALMAVQGRGELRYAGFGVMSANASYLALRAFGLIRRETTA